MSAKQPQAGDWLLAPPITAVVLRMSDEEIKRNINDIIWRAMRRAGVSSMKEPLGLLQDDGKRPDGVTMIPWAHRRRAMGRIRISHPSSTDITNTISISRQSRGEETVQVSPTCTNTYLHARRNKATGAFNAEA